MTERFEHPDDAALSQYHDREGAPEFLEAMESHLEDCEDSRARLAAFAKLSKELQDVPKLSAPGSILEGVRAGMQAPPESDVDTKPLHELLDSRAPVTPFPRRYGVAAAALFLVTMLGIWAWKGPEIRESMNELARREDPPAASNMTVQDASEEAAGATKSPARKFDESAPVNEFEGTAEWETKEKGSTPKKGSGMPKPQSKSGDVAKGMVPGADGAVQRKIGAAKSEVSPGAKRGGKRAQTLGDATRDARREEARRVGGPVPAETLQGRPQSNTLKRELPPTVRYYQDAAKAPGTADLYLVVDVSKDAALPELESALTKMLTAASTEAPDPTTGYEYAQSGLAFQTTAPAGVQADVGAMELELSRGQLLRLIQAVGDWQTTQAAIQEQVDGKTDLDDRESKAEQDAPQALARGSKKSKKSDQKTDSAAPPEAELRELQPNVQDRVRIRLLLRSG